MAFNTDWDINKYKYHYELPQHWELKKKFILCYKEKYPEDRLVCFAQIFCNVHYLGCRYEDEIMELIDDLTQGISGRNEKFDSKSFSLASNAVEAKVKAFTGQSKSSNFNTVRRTAEPISFIKASEPTGNGASSSQDTIDLTGGPLSRKRHSDSSLNGNSSKVSRYYVDEEPLSQQYTPVGNQQFNPSYNQKYNQYNQNNNQRNKWEDRSQGNRQNSYQQSSDFQHKNRSYKQNNFYSIEGKRAAATVRDVVDSGPFGRVVVFRSLLVHNESVINIVDRAASASHMTCSYDFTENEGHQYTCKLSLDNMYVAHGMGKSHRIAKEAACSLALERLKETSFTIEVKALFIGEDTTVERNSVGDVSKTRAAIDTPLAEDNIGNKMLKLMGWNGGGLGKEEQGIEEPIKPHEQNIKRTGLGITNFSDFRKKVSRILEEYAHSDSKDDLIFSTDFTKEERNTIHQLVNKYHLKSRSYGKKEENRRLVVFRKVSPLEIVEELLVCGGETEKYKLISPNPKMK